jgi:hypothetical protein
VLFRSAEGCQAECCGEESGCDQKGTPGTVGGLASRHSATHMSTVT